MSETKEISLPSRIESVEEAAIRVAEFAQNQGFGDDFVYALDMAVRESVANAVKHGNKFDESKPVIITFSNSAGDFVIEVRDFGAGFHPDEVADPTNPENLLKANGRGILFMHTFMDRVEWSNHAGGGMVVKMRKKLSEPSA